MLLNREGRIEEVPIQVPGESEVGWCHLVNPNPEEAEDILGRQFGFHPLAVEDAMHFGQRAKIDRYAHHPVPHDFISFYYFEDDLTAHEFCVIISKSLVVTVSKDEIPPLESVYESATRNPDFLATPGALLYRILDECVDANFEFVDKLEERLDNFEQRVFHHPEREIAQEIFRMKRRLQKVRRVATESRNVAGSLAHETFPFTDAVHSVYFVDVYDHASRVVDGLDAMRDNMSGLLDLQMAQRSNRMNEIMKTLTIFSTIFLPLSFIVGLYGMNVKVPEYNWTYGYAWVWALVIVVTVSMFIYFKRKGWW